MKKNSTIFADLHVHSSASDGLLSPEEIVDAAIAKGLKVIALTDHDTIAGVPLAQKYAKNKDLNVVAGIELSCSWKGLDASIHVVGLFVDESAPSLLELLEEQKNCRFRRAHKIVDLLEKAGFNMSELRQRVEVSSNQVLGRPHIARFLVEKGYVSEFQQAFDQYLSRGCPAYMPKEHIEPEIGIEAIHKAGGIAIIAHPGLISDWDKVWQRIKNMPWDGIETYYSEHSDSQIKKFAQIAQEKGWVSSGGSDYHGDHGKHVDCLGKYGLTENQYENLLAWCHEHQILSDQQT